MPQMKPMMWLAILFGLSFLLLVFISNSFFIFTWAESTQKEVPQFFQEWKW